MEAFAAAAAVSNASEKQYMYVESQYTKMQSVCVGWGGETYNP